MKDPANQTSFISLDAVCKNYDERKILDNISLTLRSPGFYSIIGASGTGKTTLLSLIAGFEKPTSGTISKKGEIGFVFQEANLLNDLSVLDNVKVVGADDIEAHALLREFGLDGLAKTKANLLSGGEKQRIAVARCLAMKADCLLLDEPTGNLDEENASLLFHQLKEISRQRIVLLVTHDTAAAKAYSDQVFSLEKGKLIPLFSKKADVEELPFEKAPSAPSDKRTLSHFEFPYATHLIRYKKSYFAASVFLIVLTLILEFFCVSFSTYDKNTSLWNATSSVKEPFYSVKKSFHDDANDEDYTFANGSLLQKYVADINGKDPFLVKGFQIKSEEVGTTAKAEFVISNDQFSEQEIQGSLPKKGQVIVTDFLGAFLFGNHDFIGKTISLPLPGSSQSSFAVSGYLKTGYSEEDFHSYFYDSSFQKSHQDAFLAKYLSVYASKETFITALNDNGSLSLKGGNFTLSNEKSSIYAQSCLTYGRASSNKDLLLLTGEDVLVSKTFYELYCESAPTPITYSYYDLKTSPNYHRYLDVLDFFDLHPSVNVIGVADMPFDVAVSDSFFLDIATASLPFLTDAIATSLSSAGQIKSLGENGILLSDRFFEPVYQIDSFFHLSVATPLWVITAFILLIVFLCSFLVFSSLINQKIHELAVLKCLGATSKNIAKVFLFYSGISFAFCYVLSIVLGSILQVLLNVFLKENIFSSFALTYSLLPFSPSPYLWLLVTAILAAMAVAMTPLMKITKIDPAILLKKTR